jgi:4,5-DOPA dioxygenase extradiol
MSNPQRMPALFIGHGSPMNTLEDNRYSRAWRDLGQSLPRPTAILCISAHWYVNVLAVTAMPRPRTIHDFGGFPQALFDYQYPAPGAPELAARIGSMLAPQHVIQDGSQWGLDHGTWSVLAHLYPKADIPVLQLSLDGSKPAQWHYELAKHLAPLRDEGVLILGSGNVVHNLGVMRRDGAGPYDWAQRFESMVRQQVLTASHQPLIDFAKAGSDATMSIPTPEHYLPLLYTLALQDASDAVRLPIDGIELGSISMLSVLVHQPPR